MLAGVEALVGGRGKAYLEELKKARNEALNDLRNRAMNMGANAIVGVDFEIVEGFMVVTAFGTAVVVEPSIRLHRPNNKNISYSHFF
ncbi:MAG: hypothetical protein DRJ32_03410 [Thermoprotei archaeon]|nr:MAG: hypothetical protein DRJ32_03410 [Thermoprotei archaeon]